MGQWVHILVSGFSAQGLIRLKSRCQLGLWFHLRVRVFFHVCWLVKRIQFLAVTWLKSLLSLWLSGRDHPWVLEVSCCSLPHGPLHTLAVFSLEVCSPVSLALNLYLFWRAYWVRPGLPMIISFLVNSKAALITSAKSFCHIRQRDRGIIIHHIHNSTYTQGEGITYQSLGIWGGWGLS